MVNEYSGIMNSWIQRNKMNVFFPKHVLPHFIEVDIVKYDN